ncbi:MAG TPA: PEP-CTERM sorting domain-containing protein [Candidatus Acidoferrales bacterium]|jgi:hypothetical protein|nr:PEP-CTERM sorting domain-containing protein [Candidatus Acidoferrales bacterium]
MNKKLIPMMVGVLCLAAVPAALAQVNNDENNNSMLYQPNVSLTSLGQNGFTGIVGGQILTPYYFYTSVNYLGYADPNNVALTDSHTVTLWDQSGNLVASAVVPAGTPTLWEGGYAWVQLSSTVTLNYNSYYEVGATVVGGADSWGDLINNSSPDSGSNGQITWNVSPNGYGPYNYGQGYGPFVQATPGYEFSRIGMYDGNAGDAGNNANTSDFGYTSAQDSIYPAPNLGYNIQAVPEPATLSMVGIGAALFLGSVLKRKKKDSVI